MSSVNSIESAGTLQWDMIELAGHLRQERLFVNSEQQNLQFLNEKVSLLVIDKLLLEIFKFFFTY